MADTRRVIFTKVKSFDLISLKSLADLLPKSLQNTFIQRYGKILRLVSIEVQDEALTALIQFYDPPMRCFLFRDFQLGPTLEEVGALMGIPLTDQKPYNYRGTLSSVQTVARFLRVTEKDLDKAQLNRRKIMGISREYLECHLKSLADKRDWDIFMEILALVIYGLVLFPSAEDLISFSAVDVFIAFRTRKESPIPAILSDIYCSLHFSHERKSKRFSCCLPILYAWFISHVISGPCREKCPIDDFSMLLVEDKNKQEWVDYLFQLEGRRIRWLSSKQRYEDVISRCGEFLNVPLMGTMGCINYNPALVQRQLGFPIRIPPTDDFVTPLELFYADEPSSESLHKVRVAWNNVVRRGDEPRSTAENRNYLTWVRKRVQEVKMPPTTNKIVATVGSDDIECEEVQDLKRKLAALIAEKEKIEEELTKSQQSNSVLKRKHDEMLADWREKHMADKLRDNQFKDTLRMANREVGSLKHQRDQLIKDKQKLMEEKRQLFEIIRTKEEDLEIFKNELDKLYQECVDKDGYIQAMQQEHLVILEGQE